MAPIRTILVPVDGSPPSLAALDHAIALAEEGDATIDILHVDAPNEFAVGATTPISSDAGREMRAAMDEAIEGAQSRLGDRVSRRTATGNPLVRIVETASEGNYDLIVMGTHGRVGRLHEMLGSVAEGVVRSAPCPVLTVREQGSGYQSFAERRHGRPSLAERTRHHS